MTNVARSSTHRTMKAPPRQLLVGLLAGVLGCSNVIVIGATPDGGSSSSTGSGTTVTPGPCTGTVTTIASEITGLTTLTADAASVYWMTEGSGNADGQIMRAPLSGGAPVTVVSDSLSMNGTTFTVNAGTLYWVSAGPWSAPAGGGSASSVFTDEWIQGPFTVDATSMYLVHWDSLSSIPLAASDPMPVPLYGGAVGLLAVDETNLYWLDDTSVHEMPKGGGAPTTLATGVRLADITLDADNVYWTDWGGPNQGQYGGGGGSSPVLSGPFSGALMKVSKAGGTPSVVASGLDLVGWNGAGATQSPGIAVDATYAYWIDAAGVERVLLLGGATETIGAVAGNSQLQIVGCPGGVCWAMLAEGAGDGVGNVMRYACP